MYETLNKVNDYLKGMVCTFYDVNTSAFCCAENLYLENFIRRCEGLSSREVALGHERAKEVNLLQIATCHAMRFLLNERHCI